jgi:hypothetical protein
VARIGGTEALGANVKVDVRTMAVFSTFVVLLAGCGSASTQSTTVTLTPVSLTMVATSLSVIMVVAVL